MKITIEHYNYKHEATMLDDLNIDEFIDNLQHIANAVWGEDRVTIIDADQLKEIIESSEVRK